MKIMYFNGRFVKIHIQLRNIELGSSYRGRNSKNVILPNNLLLNSYFENPTVELHFLYGLNMHANFQANRI